MKALSKLALFTLLTLSVTACGSNPTSSGKDGTQNNTPEKIEKWSFETDKKLEKSSGNGVENRKRIVQRALDRIYLD